LRWGLDRKNPDGAGFQKKPRFLKALKGLTGLEAKDLLRYYAT